MDNKTLLSLAEKAALHSYSPYSGFSVGAALLCSDGEVYTGCNVENVSFSATNCAERTAVFSAVADGKRDFVKIAVIAKKNGKTASFTPPCGVCRQVLSEFCEDDFSVVMTDGVNIKETALGELLPFSFSEI